MDKQTESREAFKKWWNKPEQIELRLSCAEGWGFRIWTASRDNLVAELPDEDDYVMDEALDCLRDCKQSLRAIGIRVKGEGV